METHNQYVLITGGTSGIGFQLAKIFAENGYNLVLVARNKDDLENAANLFSMFGGDVITISKDLFNRDEAYSLYPEIVNRGINIEILVNDAGQGLYGKFQDTDLNRELNIVQLNIGAMLILTKLFLHDMLVRGSGKILNLASIASKMPGPWQAVYHGTKAFVLSFSEAIREELKDTGISVTALLPGATDTDFFNKAGMNESRIVQNEELDDPTTVARDGYEALMEGKDKIISGWKNKLQVTESNMMTDSAVAHNTADMQKPADNKKE